MNRFFSEKIESVQDAEFRPGCAGDSLYRAHEYVGCNGDAQKAVEQPDEVEHGMSSCDRKGR